MELLDIKFYIKYLYIKMSITDLLLTASTPVVWGSTYLVTTELLPPGRPLLAGTLRALPVGLVLVLLCRKRPRGRWLWRVGVLGFFNIGLFFTFLFVGAYRLPGGVAATLGAVGPLLVAVLAWFWLGQKPDAATLLAGVIGVIGVGFLVLGPTAALDPLGVAAASGGALSFAVGVVLTKRWGKPDVPMLLFTAWQLVVGGLFLGLLSLTFEGTPPRLTTPNLLGFLYLGGVGTGLAYALWFRGTEKIGVSVIFLSLLSPVVAALLGYGVLAQSFSVWQGFGVLLILGSVIAGQLGARFLKRCLSKLGFGFRN